MKNSVSLEETRTALLAAAQAVVDHQDILTKADQAIGDGDHGVGMARGFKAFREALRPGSPATTIPDLLKAGGQAIMMTSGGASGVIFGSLFMGASKALSGPVLDGSGFATALAAGLDAVQARGGAKPGDKTMVDALSPAVDAARSSSGDGATIGEVAAKAASAAEKGVEDTKAMVATTGKAKSLGERSLGQVDPGALTMSIFLRSFQRTLSED